MNVRDVADQLKGEMILAVISQEDAIVPVSFDRVTTAISVVALLQLMRVDPVFRTMHAQIDHFLDTFDVGRYRSVETLSPSDIRNGRL